MELNNEMMENLNTIFVGNSLQILSTLRDKSVNCCITSPPYYGLRDYGTGEWIGGDPNCSHMRDNKNPNPDNFIPTRGKITSGSGDEIFRSICKNCGAVRQDQQIGLEESPEAYVANLVKIFREVKRVLRNDGTVWLNLGDSYWGGKGRSGAGDAESQAIRKEQKQSINHPHQSLGGKGKTRPTDRKHALIKSKDLIGIPWMVAFALRADGWYLRQDIIWSKPNPMPESVKDRCTKSHEYIFLLSKSKKYYFDADAIKTPITEYSMKQTIS